LTAQKKHTPVSQKRHETINKKPHTNHKVLNKAKHARVSVKSKVAGKTNRHKDQKIRLANKNRKIKLQHVKTIRKNIALQKTEKEKKEVEERLKREQEAALINEILTNNSVVEFLTKNVGKYAIEVMKRLSVPKTDDALAEELGVKVNEVRRVLNTLGGFGVTRYNTNKDSKGWLTFSWYIDQEKLKELEQTAQEAQKVNVPSLPEDCDDFFVCEKCYPTNKIVLPFDAAFEKSFKCPECGRPLKRLSKEEVKELFSEKVAVQA